MDANSSLLAAIKPAANTAGEKEVKENQVAERTGNHPVDDVDTDGVDDGHPAVNTSSPPVASDVPATKVLSNEDLSKQLQALKKEMDERLDKFSAEHEKLKQCVVTDTKLNGVLDVIAAIKQDQVSIVGGLDSVNSTFSEQVTRLAEQINGLDNFTAIWRTDAENHSKKFFKELEFNFNQLCKASCEWLKMYGQPTSDAAKLIRNSALITPCLVCVLILLLLGSIIWR